MSQNTSSLEDRKIKEIEWADFRRTLKASNPAEIKKYHSNMKYYSINRAADQYVEKWIRDNTKDKDVFEVACGNTGKIRYAAPYARTAIAADIAPQSIEQARTSVKNDPVLSRIDYQVRDCEHTGFADNSFDVILEGGALHHMDLDAAYAEAARILRPDGKYLCVEALRHNPFIHFYRRMTPHLRTAWEVDHILGRTEIMKAQEYFEHIEIRLFHIATLCAVPFRKTAFFKPLLGKLEAVDRVLTRIPGLRWMAWQAAYVLSNPRKDKIAERTLKRAV